MLDVRLLFAPLGHFLVRLKEPTSAGGRRAQVVERGGRSSSVYGDLDEGEGDQVPTLPEEGRERQAMHHQD